MKIAAITRYQCGQLRESLDELGWTQKVLSDQSGVPYHAISNYINLKRRITKEHLRAFNRTFKQAGLPGRIEDEWPEGWEGMPKTKITQIEDIPPENLVSMSQIKELPAPEENKREKLAELIEELTGFLRPDEVELLWLRDAEGWTLQQLADWRHVTKERIRQQHSKILRRIRWKYEKLTNEKRAEEVLPDDGKFRFDPVKHAKFLVYLPEVLTKDGIYRSRFDPDEIDIIERFVEKMLNAGRDPGFKYKPERDDAIQET